jgi:hypothetical protein
MAEQLAAATAIAQGRRSPNPASRRELDEIAARQMVTAQV